ncbi:hypothetical protein [Kutzneria albida]|uniref:Head-to-tail stopper n=1 Tax=Kutzneria albida DSM 43870 TaxID=1449976 RepID=W5WJI7_9PSEU|nr:hypothetical protein [Kutzneria albida]AHH98329.1 hypothetical protein KALB_4967 [Kutzneria albida DSM 43870]
MTVPLGQQTLILVSRSDGAKDNMGVPARIEVETSVSGCSWQPASADEDVVHDVDRAEDLWNAWIPGGTGARVIDAIKTPWDGLQYEIQGTPQTWVDAFGRVSHTILTARRVTG